MCCDQSRFYTSNCHIHTRTRGIRTSSRVQGERVSALFFIFYLSTPFSYLFTDLPLFFPSPIPTPLNNRFAQTTSRRGTMWILYLSSWSNHCHNHRTHTSTRRRGSPFSLVFSLMMTTVTVPTHVIMDHPALSLLSASTSWTTMLSIAIRVFDRRSLGSPGRPATPITAFFWLANTPSAYFRWPHSTVMTHSQIIQRYKYDCPSAYPKSVHELKTGVIGSDTGRLRSHCVLYSGGSSRKLCYQDAE